MIKEEGKLKKYVKSCNDYGSGWNLRECKRMSQSPQSRDCIRDDRGNYSPRKIGQEESSHIIKKKLPKRSLNVKRVHPRLKVTRTIELKVQLKLLFIQIDEVSLERGGPQTHERST